MVPVLFVLSLHVGMVVNVAPAAEARPAGLEDVQFLGFSRNEAAYAWRLQFARAYADGSRDVFALVELRDSRTGARVALFRQGSIVRRNAEGHTVAVANAARMAANQEFVKAEPQGVWDRLRQKGQFRAVRHAFGDGLVRLLPDADCHLKIDVVHKEARVRGTAGQALGYTPMARLFDGTQLPLSHFRAEAMNGQVVTAELQVHHSRSGRLIAVLNQFHPENGGPLSVQTVVMDAGQNPIASVGMHPQQIIDWQAASARQLYRGMHPKTMKDYDTYVGLEF